ncbi:MAG: class I SAM-dependent methyltransferase [Bacteroidota bacterium]
MTNQITEKSELDAQEVLSYYNQFYTSDDFKYYSEIITRKFFRGIFAKCHISPPGKILDVGCGTGYYCNIFHEMGFQSVGVDFSQTAIARAKEKYPNLEFSAADATDLPFEPLSFDVVLSYGCSVVSTYDISKIHDYVRHLMTFVKPAGWFLLIGGSNLSGRRLDTSSWLCHKWEDLLRFVPEGDWRALGPYLSHVRLVSIIGRFGLKPVVTSLLRPLGFHFVRNTFHLIQRV